jgi:transcriptional regulator with XRE-family HTH domain
MTSRTVHDGFTERFKLALVEAGYDKYKLRELAALFEVSPQAVKKWRSGESMPKAERMPLVAQKLGVRRAWLFDSELPMRALAGVGNAAEGYAVPSISISGKEENLLMQFRLLPSTLQMHFLGIFGELAGHKLTEQSPREQG